MARSLDGIVRDVADELSLLAGTAACLQDQIGGACPGEGGIVALQSLDHLTQALGCLAEFLTALSDELPAQCRPGLGRALGAVWLSDIAGRLGGSAPAAPAGLAGECEFFGAD